MEAQLIDNKINQFLKVDNYDRESELTNIPIIHHIWICKIQKKRVNRQGAEQQNMQEMTITRGKQDQSQALSENNMTG